MSRLTARCVLHLQKCEGRRVQASLNSRLSTSTPLLHVAGTLDPCRRQSTQVCATPRPWAPRTGCSADWGVGALDGLYSRHSYHGSPRYCAVDNRADWNLRWRSNCALQGLRWRDTKGCGTTAPVDNCI